jgi:hypothetical protein
MMAHWRWLFFSLLLFPLDADPSVDVVITWLNDTSPLWQQSFRKYKHFLGENPLEGEGDSSLARYRDFFILDYVVFSCCKNMPWIQSIHIIISDLHGPPNWHLPTFKYCPNISIRFHTHHELLSSGGYHSQGILPTFNSAAIELLIQFIPNLADYFLYVNDDHLIVKPVRREDMFREDKRSQRRLPVYYLDNEIDNRPKELVIHKLPYYATAKALQKVAEREGMSSHDITVANERLCWSLHAPIFFQRDWLRAALAKVGVHVGLTLTHRTRNAHDITFTMSLYPYYLLLYHPEEVYWITSHPLRPSVSENNFTHSLGQEINEVTSVELMIRRSPAEIADLKKNQFIGIQDESEKLFPSEFLQMRKLLRDRLADLFSVEPFPLD